MHRMTQFQLKRIALKKQLKNTVDFNERKIINKRIARIDQAISYLNLEIAKKTKQPGGKPGAVNG